MMEAKKPPRYAVYTNGLPFGKVYESRAEAEHVAAEAAKTGVIASLFVEEKTYGRAACVVPGLRLMGTPVSLGAEKEIARNKAWDEYRIALSAFEFADGEHAKARREECMAINRRNDAARFLNKCRNALLVLIPELAV